MTKTINIADEFSKFPGPRFKELGKYSGEEFRESFLIPALNENQLIRIVFDGAMGYGSSFLEEAFGGLVRAGYKKEDLISRLELISEEDPSLISDIHEYIEDV